MTRPILLPFVLACSVGLASPALPQQSSARPDQTILTPDEARLTAGQLLSTGQVAAAQDILTVLILRDPEDAPSLILLAYAHRLQGNMDAARTAARAAWRHGTQDYERYAAAIAMAQALSKDNQKSRAQLWLRRAAHVAPTEALRARAVRDYSFVRLTNPWSVNLRFGVSPSDNINNAPKDNTIALANGAVLVNRASVPLEGFEVRTGADIRYNFNISQTKRNFAQLSWDQAWVVLTDNDVPEGVSASDFSYTKLEATIGQDWQASAEAARRTVSLSYGKIWYGGEYLSNKVTARYRQTHRLGETQTLSLYGSLGYTHRLDKDQRSGTSATLGTVWTQQLEDGAVLSLNAEVGLTDTDSRLLDHEALGIGATYVLAAQPLGAVTSFSVNGKFRRYDAAGVYGPDARADDGLSVSTSLFFKDFDTYGFAPKLTLSASRTDSNVPQFETENIGLSIGYQSVF